MLSGMSRGHGKGRLAAAARGLLRLGGVLAQVILQRPRLLGHRGELGPVEAQQNAGGFRGDGLIPYPLWVGEGGGSPEAPLCAHPPRPLLSLVNYPPADP